MADAQSRTGTTYGTHEILAWTEEQHAQTDAALQAAFDSPGKTGLPAIQLGVSESRFVEWLLKLVGAKHVVEVGTLAGYSALRIARALPEGGTVRTIELDPHHAQVARDNFARAEYGSRIEVLQGAALDVLPKLSSVAPFDAVFIDADKDNYPHYVQWAADNLRPGGLLIADNVYLFGELLDAAPTAVAMRQAHALASEYFDTACLSTPDGMLLGVRR